MDCGAAILDNAILDIPLPLIKPATMGECLAGVYVEDRETWDVLRLSAARFALLRSL